MANVDDVIRVPLPEDFQFNQLLMTVSESLTGEAFTKAKNCCIDELGKALVDAITEPWDLLVKLKERCIIRKDMILLLQRFVYFIPNEALRARTLYSIIVYAQDTDNCYVQEAPPPIQIDDSSQLMHMHINIHIPDRLRNKDLARLEQDVARMFGVDRRRVSIVGIIHGNSYVVTLRIPRECAEMIPDLVELGIKDCITLEVDKIAIDGQMFDLKDKRKVVDNVEEHQQDFLSVYENLERKQQKIQELELRIHNLQKEWEEESKNFSKSEIEKQLQRGDLCDSEYCGEVATRITELLVRLIRETESVSHLRHHLKAQKEWTKGNDIKILAVIAGEALKAGESSIKDIECFLRNVIKRNGDYSGTERPATSMIHPVSPAVSLNKGRFGHYF